MNERGTLLSSWKEIAAYLGVSVRTTQKWEAERGLPVRRIPGGRGRVMVSTAELSSWLESRATTPPPVEPVVPTPAVNSRVMSWRLVTVLIGFVLLVTVVGAAWWRSSRLVPSSWRVSGDALVVLDDRGNELWRKTYGFPLKDYEGTGERQLGWVGDLDGDGHPEVLFAAFSTKMGQPMVYCYDHSGTERWRFAPGGSASSFPEEFRPPYFPLNLAVFRVGGAVRIAVASVHHVWFPSQIALLSSDGRLLREYWHAGNLQFLAVADWAGTGKPLLYAGGISNAHNAATLVTLDPEDFGGTAREENPKYQLPGAPPGEIARVLFPRSCISKAKEPYNGVQSLQVRPNGLIVAVMEEAFFPSAVMHTFDPDGRYRGAGLSSNYAARHNELEREKLLDHHLNAEQETAALTQLRWLTSPPTITAQRKD